ncbi:unnamed protein product [Nippostrongylus brasiliensis]|uniref:Uncharacterized protein n=1 Tax=Nippostrongylus brasiliensis TaxID=27835 RepID=A0A0N4XZ54_NIPBR|nr:unnamed protein product [Nippostrongylus brasiliensis]
MADDEDRKSRRKTMEMYRRHWPSRWLKTRTRDRGSRRKTMENRVHLRTDSFLTILLQIDLFAHLSRPRMTSMETSKMLDIKDIKESTALWNDVEATNAITGNARFHGFLMISTTSDITRKWPAANDCSHLWQPLHTNVRLETSKEIPAIPKDD